MRKKTRVILAAAGLTAVLFGCGQDAKVIEGDVKTMGRPASQEQDTSGEVQEASDVRSETEAEETPQYRGYAFIYDGVVVEMDADAAPIVEALGDANSYFEAPSCAFEGIDKMYTYSSFELDTYPMKDKDYVSSVIFKDDAIITPEGVGIGDSVEKMVEVYGEDSVSESGMTVYKKDDMKLCFIIQDDSIASIEYRSTVLDE